MYLPEKFGMVIPQDLCEKLINTMQIPFLSLKDVTALHGAEINESVSRVVNSGWYLQGEENARFEQHYAEYIGTEHCVGCAHLDFSCLY